jgi:hypothetical protein
MRAATPGQGEFCLSALPPKLGFLSAEAWPNAIMALTAAQYPCGNRNRSVRDMHD